MCLAQFMDDESGAKFGFKPSGLRRHDVARVCDVHDLFHGDGIEGQCHLHLSAVHTTFQLTQSADTAHEVDALVGTKVLDS